MPSGVFFCFHHDNFHIELMEMINNDPLNILSSVYYQEHAFGTLI